MRDNIVILHAERVEYPVRTTNGDGERVATGEVRSFCRLKYISDEPYADARYKGYQVQEGVAPVEVFDQLELLPGLYEATFRKQQQQDRYGRQVTTVQPVTVELVGDPGLTFDVAKARS